MITSLKFQHRRAAYAEPPLVSLDSIRRRAIQRRVTQAGVTSLAVLAVGLGATYSAYAAGSGPQTIGGAKVPAGPPSYYVAQKFNHGPGMTIVVRRRTTGVVTSVVRQPLAKGRCGDQLAAAGTRTFFMACLVWSQKPGSTAKKIKFRETVTYRFEVSNRGKATTPTLVKGSKLKGLYDDGQFAASPDGSEVALEVFRPNPNGVLYTNSIPSGIFVINTKTGKRAFWRTGRYVPGRLGFDGASDVSFTQNGSELVIKEKLCHRTRYLSNCQSSDPTEVRTFGPADRGGSLQGGRILLRLSAFKKPGTFLPDALITPDGTALNSVIANCPKRGLCTLTVARIAFTTGKVLNKLYQVRTGTRFEGIDMRSFGSDPTGRFLMLNAADSPTSKWVNGWIDHGRLVKLAPVDFGGQEVW